MNFYQYFIVLGIRFFYLFKFKNIGQAVHAVDDRFHRILLNRRGFGKMKLSGLTRRKTRTFPNLFFHLVHVSTAKRLKLLWSN